MGRVKRTLTSDMTSLIFPSKNSLNCWLVEGGIPMDFGRISCSQFSARGASMSSMDQLARPDVRVETAARMFCRRVSRSTVEEAMIVGRSACRTLAAGWNCGMIEEGERTLV